MDNLALSALLAQIKPFVCGWMGSTVSGAALDVGAHTHPEYAELADVETITGAWTFNRAGAPFAVGAAAADQLVDGLNADLLDGYEAAAFAAAVHYHAHSALTGLAEGDDHTQYLNVSRHDTTGRHTLGSVVPHDALASLSEKEHHNLSGLSDDDHPQYAALAHDEVISGAWTFQGITTARHILPEATDTYDLGSSLKWWRHGYLSELDAVIFAQQTVSLVGGWFVIGHNEGALPADVAADATQIDFGTAMTPNDFVLFRSIGHVEYMQIGAVVSGTTYNVTRDKDGSGANAWAAGSPFLVLGTTGDGRIELNSYDTPRISLVRQGATYNAQTEVLRIGDLNAGWGYTAETYGIALGVRAASNVNVTLDATNGLRFFLNATQLAQWDASGNILVGQTGAGQANVYISAGAVKLRNNTTDVISLLATANAAGQIATFDGVIGLSSAGGIYQGTGTFASPTTGLKVWSDGGVGRIAGYNATVLQWYASTDGKLYAGAGSVTLDASGLTVRGMGSGDVIEEGGTITTIKLTSPTGGLVKGQIYYQGTNNVLSALGIHVSDYGTALGFIRLDNKTVLVHGLDVGYTASAAGDGEIIASQDGRFGGGLYVGATNVDPAAGTLMVSGAVTAGGTITTQSDAIPLMLISCHNDLAYYRPELRFRRSRGTMASPTAVVSGTWLVALYSYAHDGTNYNTNAGQIRLEAAGAVSAGVVPSRWAFATMNAAGALADRVTIEPSGSIAFPAVSPASLAAHTNNWAPGGGSFVRVTSNGDYNITGMVAGVDGEVRHVVNVGVYALTLIHESASSTAANRFNLKSYADLIIAKRGGITLIYDATDARWRGVAYTY